MRTHTFPIHKAAISAASNASPVSFTSAAHGLPAFVTVTISGGAAAWAVVNGDYVATKTGADTFTVPYDTSLLGAAAGSLVFSEHAPVIAQAYTHHIAVYENARAGTTKLLVRAPFDDNTAISKTENERSDFDGAFRPGEIAGYLEAVSAVTATMAQEEE